MSRFIVCGISEAVPLFPPGPPVTVVIDGRPLPEYLHAYAFGGRIYTPVAPLLTRLADRLWFDGATLVVQRGDRIVRIALQPTYRGEMNGAYVPAGPALRALGVRVRYDAIAHRLIVNVPLRSTVSSPTPFNAAVPSAAPVEVFTPMPVTTPRPVWTGSPLPRRTALPLPPPL